jgi:hypothetical protein
MKLKICFVIWPPIIEYIPDIVKDIKKEFEFISCSIFEFPEKYNWFEIMNIIYNDPLDRITVKRHQKADGFEGFVKKVGVVIFNVVDPSYKKKGGKIVLVEVHDLKKYWRDDKFKKIPRWLIVHSTESTDETEKLLENVKRYTKELLYEDN